MIVLKDFADASAAADPNPNNVEQFVFAPTPVTIEKGNRAPETGEKMTNNALKELCCMTPQTLLQLPKGRTNTVNFLAIHDSYTN